MTGLFAGVTIVTGLVSLFALAINRFDWGVGLIFFAPLVVWLLLRLGGSLERWANGRRDAETQDPDFPDDSA